MSDPIDSVPSVEGVVPPVEGNVIAKEPQHSIIHPDTKKDETITLPAINTTQAQAIPSDVGTNKDDIAKALTETEKKPVVAATSPETVGHVSSVSPTPGAYVYEPMDKHGLPTWYSAFSSKTISADDAATQFISETYFVEWFHNSGVVFTAIFFTWLLIKVRLGFMSCLIVGAFFATYYRTSIKRTRRNTRDDMQREASLHNLGIDFESVDWINHFLERFWLIFEPALSAQIIGQVDTALSENTPSFLDSIRLTSFTLGTKAPRVDGIKVYPKAAPDIVCMDWKLSFIPNDVMDLTAREAEAKANPKIVLTIRVGKGMIGAGMPILLEDIAFSGQLRIKLKLFNEMPHVKSVDISFLEKPHFEYVLKPVGGETFGFDINNIPGLESFVKDQVHANLGPMMYAPNVFTLDVAALMAGAVDSESANGVLAVTLYSANGLKPVDLFSGSVDAYCTFHVHDTEHPELARTGVVENSSHPSWNETHFLLLNNLNDTLCFKVMDRNTNRADSDVGVATLDLKEVEEGDNQAIEGLNLMVMRGGRPVGELKADVHYFPVSKPDKQEDGTVVPAETSNSGVARLSVIECKEVGKEVKKLLGGGSGDINAYAVVKINGQEALRTTAFKRSASPRWNKSLEVFVADKANAHVSITVMNSVDFGEDAVLGHLETSMEAMEEQLVENDWWSLTNGSGKIHLDLVWKPVPLTGFVAGLTRGAYAHPVGVVRIKLVSAATLKNADALTGGKSDPYVRVMSGLQMRARTEAVLDNLDPVWDTAVFIPIHSLREDLSLEVMDFNTNQNDKLLGLCELAIKDLASVEKTTTTEDVAVYHALPPVTRTVDLMSRDRKKGGRGTLTYEAAFYPTLALAQQEEEVKPDTEDAPLPEVNPAATPQVTDLHGETIRYTATNTIDLLSYPAGVLSVKIHDATLASKKNAVAEILLDAADAQFRTSPAKGSTRLDFNASGDAFVRELDLSRLTVRLRDAKDDNDAEENLGYWSSSITDIVKGLMSSSDDDVIREYKLFGGSGGTVRLSFRYTPVVQFTLDPNDSLENQGNLAITAVSASGLKAADKSGTSDPYCVFLLDGEKVYKTQTYKKQLAPTFKDEKFVVAVAQRRKAKLGVRIYDWDQIGSHTLLAEGTIPIADLESYVATDVEVPLRGGMVALKLKWEPQVLARKRVGTTLIGSTVGLVSGSTNLAINTGTRVVGGAIGGGTKVVSGGTKIVSGAIGGGVGALGRGLNMFGGSRKSTDMTTTATKVTPTTTTTTTTKVTPPLPTTTTISDASGSDVVQTSGFSEEPALSQTKSISSAAASSTVTRTKSIFEGNGNKRNVNIRVHIVEGKEVGGKDKMSDAYVRVRVDKQSVFKTKHMKKNNDPEWNESFTTAVSGTSVLEFTVRNRNTLADSDIGSVSFHVGEHVDAGKSFDGWLTLSPTGKGQIRVQIEVIQA